MTVDVFIQDIVKIQDYLRTDFTEDVMVVGSKDLSVKIGNRVEETGELASGNKGFYKSNSYKQKRAAKGMQTSYKDYSFTREMWSGFGIIKRENLKVTLGGNTRASQDKINWNSKTEIIINPNQRELEDLVHFVETKLLEYINQTLI